MRTLAFCLTSVFVTLKVVDKLSWSWFWILCPVIFWVSCWVILFVIYNAASIQERAVQIKANRKRQEEIDGLNQRIKDLNRDIQNTGAFNDHVREQYKNVKTIVLILVACTIMYSCRPSYSVTRCPKPPTSTFNK